MTCPSDVRWLAVKHMLRYLKGSLCYDLTLSKASQLGLTTYCDTNWASALDDQRSTSVYCVFLEESLMLCFLTHLVVGFFC